MYTFIANVTGKNIVITRAMEFARVGKDIFVTFMSDTGFVYTQWVEVDNYTNVFVLPVKQEILSITELLENDGYDVDFHRMGNSVRYCCILTDSAGRNIGKVGNVWECIQFMETVHNGHK